MRWITAGRRKIFVWPTIIVLSLAGIYYHWTKGMYSAENGVICHVGIPCVYPERVDIRFIVLTMNRNISLNSTLNSLQKVQLDGDAAALEVFVDRSKEGIIHQPTVDIATNFEWKQGIYRVHVREVHAGLYSQWIDTWRPREQEVGESDELSIIIEDDIDISPFAYRWLRQVHRKQGNKDFISGYCLQDLNIVAVTGKSIRGEINKINRDIAKKYPAYFYRVAGSWAFAPHPKQWLLFQDWFYTDGQDIVHPYVPEAKLNTGWYKNFERQRRTDSMWTMWFIYFTNMSNSSALFSNIPQYSGNRRNSLVCNRLEPGLHFKKRKRKVKCKDQLMTKWSENFTNFEQLPAFTYNSSFVGIV